MQVQEQSAPPTAPRGRPGRLWQIGASLFILAVPLFLISSSVRLIAQNPGFYEYGFGKYNVSERTALPPTELARAARAFVAYFETNDEWLHVTVTDRSGRTFPLYNERELLHMKDVKGLFQLVWRLQLLSGCWLVLYGAARFLRFGQPAIKSLRWLGMGGGVATLLVVANLGLLALIDFESVFVQFHLLSFTNDLWLLNPERDYLLMMFPGGFFFDSTLAIAALSVAGALVLIGVAGWLVPRLDSGRAS